MDRAAPRVADGEKKMTKRFFTTVAAAGILALSMGANAIAGDGLSDVNDKHTVTLVAGTTPESIELKFADAQRVIFYQAGTLQITRQDGTTWKYRPNVTQNVNGKRKNLIAGFRILGRDRVAVSVYKADPTAPVLVEGRNPNS